MMKDREEDLFYEQDMELLSKAMLTANEAFNEFFEEQGLDGAFFDVEMTGYVLSTNFERMRKVDMDFMLPQDDDEIAED